LIKPVAQPSFSEKYKLNQGSSNPPNSSIPIIGGGANQINNEAGIPSIGTRRTVDENVNNTSITSYN
jgi:hypothetical protein